MKKLMSVCGQQKEVAFVRKKGMKSIRLRVEDDGAIRVSLPYGVPYAAAEQFVQQRAQWIEQALSRLAKKAPPMCAETLDDGTGVRLLGRAYLVRRGEGAASICADHSRGLLWITGAGPEDESALRARFDRWWRAESLALYSALCKRYLPFFSAYGVAMPDLSVRRMTSRWGSCGSNGRICLNYFLLRAPMPAVEYILLHELTHLINPSHNRAFYSFIAQIMPDWKERRALLEWERCC